MLIGLQSASNSVFSRQTAKAAQNVLITLPVYIHV